MLLAEAWNFFEDILPAEITISVLSYFSLEDVVYVSLVCKSWNMYFDTKEIWKKIYEFRFGTVEGKLVDLTQNLRWKRLYFKACSAAAWKKDFLVAKDAFFCNYAQDQYTHTSYNNLSANGRYHVVIINGVLAVTDIKMAAKIIPMNHNPVELYSARSFNIAWENDFRSNVQRHHDSKPPKDNMFVLKHISSYNGYSSLRAETGKGEFLFSLSGYDLLLYNIETHALNPEKTLTTKYMQQVTGMTHSTSFNSKFMAYVYNQIKFHEGYIIDMSKKCLHCCNIHNKNGKYVPETTVCNDPNNCAIIARFTEKILRQVFASQLNLNKILFFGVDDNISIWTHGEGLKDVKCKNARNVSMLSEHVVEVNGVKRHWFTYSTNKKYFIDLNNTSDRIEMPLNITLAEWVPKKSKIAVVLQAKLTVYDLESKTWSVKLVLPDPITAVLFTASGTGLFLATAKHIHFYIWETALHVASLPHNITAPIVKLHFALNQALLLSTANKTYYLKIRSKLDI